MKKIENFYLLLMQVIENRKNFLFKEISLDKVFKNRPFLFLEMWALRILHKHLPWAVVLVQMLWLWALFYIMPNFKELDINNLKLWHLVTTWGYASFCVLFHGNRLIKIINYSMPWVVIIFMIAFPNFIEKNGMMGLLLCLVSMSAKVAAEKGTEVRMLVVLYFGLVLVLAPDAKVNFNEEALISFLGLVVFYLGLIFAFYKTLKSKTWKKYFSTKNLE